MHSLHHEFIYGVGFTIVGLIGGILDARKCHRIPNWLTFPAILAGFIAHGILDGWPGLDSAGIAVGLLFLIMLPVILRRGMGMGDYKLLLATSAFAGMDRFLWVLFFSVVIAGGMALAISLYTGYLKTAIRNTFAIIGHMAVQPLTPHPELNIDNAEIPKFPFGVAVALGCLTTVIYSGAIR